jgi:hypothetical protein
VRSPQDAHAIFHGVALGILPMITRRLDTEERRAITSGVIRKKPVEYAAQCSQDSQDSPVVNPLVCSSRRELHTATELIIAWHESKIPTIAS